MKPSDASTPGFRLDPAELKPLYQTKPWLHAAAMSADWLLIFSAMILCIRFPSPWMYFFAVWVIGARMHALAILMHDATHYRFLKNKTLNDLLSNLFIMYPLFSSIEVYRSNHLAHHQKLNTAEDPDWVAKLGNRAFTFPKSKAAFFLMLGSYLSLYQGIMDAIWFLKRFGGHGNKQTAPRRGRLAKWVFYLLLGGGITWLGAWKYYLLFWIVPYLSTFFMFQYIRSVAEHFGGLAYDNLLTSTRTVKPTLLERFFISPHQVGYHLEHHLYPGVPFYHLPRLHKLLCRQDEFAAKAHVTRGYATGLLRELSQSQDPSATCQSPWRGRFAQP
ncbi:MAG: fatty acid desaturase family protein [Bacteroidia bacterium]